MNEKKVLCIELLKFIAALMITNSHFKPLYPDILSPLGTFGAPGNALFFFISGYTLSLKGMPSNFMDWYKKRIKRIWPTTLIWNSFFSYLLIGKSLSFKDAWLGGDFWFIHCIAIYYILFFIIKRFNMIKTSIVISILLSIIYFIFILPISKHSIYITDWHYICFFSTMMTGAYCATYRDKIISKNVSKNITLAIISFILFYAIQIIGKGKISSLYYIQVLSLLPLHTFLLYFYKTVDMDWCNKLINIKGVKFIIMSVAALTLEIYLVGFSAINIQFNELFPLNLLIILASILVQAYLLKILTNLLLQILENEKFRFKQIFKLF